MYKVSDRLLVWGSSIDPAAISQAAAASKLPFVPGHVALPGDGEFEIVDAELDGD